MKNILKSILKTISVPLDLIFSLLVVPAAYLLLIYRKIGARPLQKTTKRLKKIGIFPLRNHYYEPLFDDRLLSFSLDKKRLLPGINLNFESQLNLLNKLNFNDELVSLNLKNNSKSIDSYFIDNGEFESGDADFLYQIIRHTKPQRIVEIGSGNSTKIARLALIKNKSESNKDYEHICIEPYEQPWLEKLAGTKIIRELVENCKFDWTNGLESGDLLFIDSSHIIRPQGDVLKIYLEIFPQLKPGVLVHVHDIFTPRDYPKSWIVDEVKFWNEQYLLEALLTNTNRYEVVAALNFLKSEHYDIFKQVCPYLSEDREPGSFYFKVRL